MPEDGIENSHKQIRDTTSQPARYPTRNGETSNSAKAACFCLQCAALALRRPRSTYETVKDRFYGLVTCELAAAHFGGELVGVPVYLVTGER